MPSKKKASRRNASGSRTLGGDAHVIVRGRFASAATAEPVTRDLCCAAGAIATSSSSLSSFYAACRIKRIRVVGPPPSQGDVSTVSLEATAGSANFDQRVQKLSSSNNPVKTPVINFVPPTGSAASFWSDSAGAKFYRIRGPAGTVVEFTLDLAHPRPGTAPQTNGVLVAGLTTGDVYYGQLANDLLTISDGSS